MEKQLQLRSRKITQIKGYGGVATYPEQFIDKAAAQQTFTLKRDKIRVGERGHRPGGVASNYELQTNREKPKNTSFKQYNPIHRYTIYRFVLLQKTVTNASIATVPDFKTISLFNQRPTRKYRQRSIIVKRDDNKRKTHPQGSSLRITPGIQHRAPHPEIRFFQYPEARLHRVL